MALVKLTFQPGFNRDWTNYANSGGWYDGTLVRFRNGLPESFGGWTKVSDDMFAGVCSSLWSWTALDGGEYTSIGTSEKFYIEKGGSFSDATPIRLNAAALGTDPFAYTDGSATVLVTHTAHGAGINDYVEFAGATTFGSISAASVNKEHQITTIVDDNSYEVVLNVAATGTGSGGGSSVTATYQINTGPGIATLGSGFGAGAFGGAKSPRLSVTLPTNPLDTTSSSTTINVSHTSHGAADGDNIVISGADSVGGIPAWEINRAHEITYVDADNYTIEAVTSASSSTTGGGTAVSIAYYEESDVGWGDGSPSSVSTNPRLWSQDNYGEDLVFCPRNAPIYYWDKDGSARGSALSDLSGMDGFEPAKAKQVMVSAARHLIGYGVPALGETEIDPLLIRWADTENFYEWFPSSTNAAGQLRMENGSYFVQAIEGRQEIVVWTDTAIHSMQYLGPPYTYGITPLSTNITIFGPRAGVMAMDRTFWMGLDNFYVYDGRIRELPCTVWDYVFNNINRSEGSYLVVAGTNRAFNEVIWNYPSENSQVNDKYVIYNYRDNLWYFGDWNGAGRSAWIDRGFEGKPRGAGNDGYVYYHEDGLNDNSVSPSVALNPFIEGSPVEIGDGERFMFMWRVIPDVTFRASNAATPTGVISITPRDHPADELGTTRTGNVDRTSSLIVEQHTTQLDMRVRGRSLIYRFSSSERGVGWRHGVPRIDVRPDGRR